FRGRMGETGGCNPPESGRNPGGDRAYGAFPGAGREQIHHGPDHSCERRMAQLVRRKTECTVGAQRSVMWLRHAETPWYMSFIRCFPKDLCSSTAPEPSGSLWMRISKGSCKESKKRQRIWSITNAMRSS